MQVIDPFLNVTKKACNATNTQVVQESAGQHDDHRDCDREDLGIVHVCVAAFIAYNGREPVTIMDIDYSIERRSFLAALVAASLRPAAAAAVGEVKRTKGSHIRIGINAYSFNRPLTAGTMTLGDVVDRKSVV